MYKRKDGRYQQAVKIGGEWRTISGKTQRDVMQRIREAEAKHDRSQLFAGVADQFERDRMESMLPGTLRVYRPALREAVEFFGDMHITEIKPRDVTRYMQSMTSRYAQKTMQNRLGVLSQVFVYAINDLGVDMANPCADIRLPQSRIKAQTRRPLTDAQRAEIDRTQPDEFCLAILIVNTGARLGEACALQWKDIDFDRNEIRITKSMHWDGNRPYVGRLKTENGERIVPLLSPLREFLSQLSPKPDNYIVSGPEPLTASQLERRWIRFCQDHNMAYSVEKTWHTHGVARKHIKWMTEINRHQIRHDYATSLFRAGVPVKSVQHLLGHADYQTTMDIYVHWQRESVEDARQMIESYIQKKAEAVE